jgi:hypothetical protein
MRKCPFFNIQTRELNTVEMLVNRSPGVETVDLPWCFHKYSPATLKEVTTAHDGATKLKCGGDLDKCPLPRGHFLDY